MIINVATIITKQMPITIKPLVDGKELMEYCNKGPGKWIGEIHKVLIDKQLENPKLNKEEAWVIVKEEIAADKSV